MLYHVSNNSALPIVLAGSDTRVMEWIVWDDLCKKSDLKCEIPQNSQCYGSKTRTWDEKKQNKTKQMLQPEKADN